MGEILPVSLTPNSSYFTKDLFYRLLFVVIIFALSVFTLSVIVPWRGGSPTLQSPAGIQFSAHPSQLDHLNSSSSTQDLRVSHVIPDLKGWNFNDSNNLTTKICITTTTSAGLDQVLSWIFYHKVLGVTNFFLFVEGKAANANTSKVLESIHGVQVIHRTRELEEQQAKSEIWNNTGMSFFFNKPCNSELFLKQSLNMEVAIDMAKNASMEWILHIDTDELLHPAGTREYSIRELLTEVPKDVDTVVFTDYESAVESDNITEPFKEVSMFKKNYAHLPREVNSKLIIESTRDNPNFFLTYGNGKSAARVQEHLRAAGAHRWQNAMRPPKEIQMNETAVLHYTYSRFSDLTSRRDRCHCKLTTEDLNKCFFLEFDRMAYLVASNSTEKEMLKWYQEHVVWKNETLNLNMIRAGILTRIYTPMVIIRQLRQSGVFGSVIASAQAASPYQPQG